MPLRTSSFWSVSLRTSVITGVVSLLAPVISGVYHSVLFFFTGVYHSLLLSLAGVYHSVLLSQFSGACHSLLLRLIVSAVYHSLPHLLCISGVYHSLLHIISGVCHSLLRRHLFLQFLAMCVRESIVSTVRVDDAHESETIVRRVTPSWQMSLVLGSFF